MRAHDVRTSENQSPTPELARKTSDSSQAADVLGMQQAVGNQAVTSMLARQESEGPETEGEEGGGAETSGEVEGGEESSEEG